MKLRKIIVLFIIKMIKKKYPQERKVQQLHLQFR